MTSNNYERMKIVLAMVDPFDYDEFLRICETEKVPPLSINEYAMKVGYVMMAQGKHSDMPVEEAYMKIVEAANNQFAQADGNKTDKPLPPLMAQVGNLVSAVGHHMATGFKETDDEILKERVTLCNNCEDMRTDGRCSKCGCCMQRKAKWDSAKCPVNKW